jgi:hypothetical protein
MGDYLMGSKLTKIFLVYILIFTFLITLNFSIGIKAFTPETWQNYSFESSELFCKTNTFNYSKIVNLSGEVTQYYDLNNSNDEVVTTNNPLLTILTPGLSSTAGVWSNENGHFTYCPGSIISRLDELTGGANVYWYKMRSDKTFKIINISEQTNEIKAGNRTNYSEYYNYVVDSSNNFRITDISKPIIILFESSDTDGYNNVVYEELNFVISKATYDIKLLSNGVLPRINLIGHSRGGITNLQYALDHPELVASIFSLGTPYLGSTSAMIDFGLFEGAFGGGTGTGEEDIINSIKYLGYMQRWNESYDELYENIPVHAIGSYSTLLFLKYIFTSDYAENELTVLERAGIITIIDALQDIETLSKVAYFINNNIFTNRMYSIAEDIVSLLGMTSAPGAVYEILMNEIRFDSHFPFISWYNDGLVDLESQLGSKQLNNATIEYRGFSKKIKCFTISNSNIENIAFESFSVVHNLETRDDELISYITKNIEMSGKTISDFETYTVSDTEIGIKTILNNVSSNALYIPNTINGKVVVEIADSAFSDNFNSNTNITHVFFPVTIKKIGKNAFENCANLENIYIPSNSQLEEIGDYAFYNCFSLLSAMFPPSVQELGDFVFLNCDSLTGYSYNSSSFFNVGTFNCRTEQFNDCFYVNKGYSLYFKIEIDCLTYYDFNAIAQEEINLLLYDENMEIVFNEPVSIINGTNENIIRELDVGVYYLRVDLCDETSESEVEISLDHRPTSRKELLVNDADDALEHLHDGHNEYYFLRSTSGFYEFTLVGEKDGVMVYPEGTITIFDDNNIVQKYTFYGSTYQNPADSISNANSMILLIEGFSNYYIDIDINPEGITSLELLATTPNEFGLNSNDVFSSENDLVVGDKIEKLTIERTGEYHIKAIYNGNQTEDMLFIILKKNSDNTFSRVGSGIIDNVSFYEDDNMFFSNENYFIGYFNGRGTGTFSLQIKRNISNTFSIVTDPNENVTVGSEVTLNNGAYGGTTLTQGYTRICYLGTDAPNMQSRTQYYWYSTDSSIALVSAYGTVTATATWQDSIQLKTVVIRAVYKTDPKIIGEITLTIYKDSLENQNNIIILSNYGMDVRDGGVTGTEVSSGKGSAISISPFPTVTVHQGYTRLVCIGTGTPSNIIQHFNWSIDRQTGETGDATVSQFGTIQGISIGEITIKGVYKFNPRYIIYITVQVLSNQ